MAIYTRKKDDTHIPQILRLRKHHVSMALTGHVTGIIMVSSRVSNTSKQLF